MLLRKRQLFDLKEVRTVGSLLDETLDALDASTGRLELRELRRYDERSKRYVEANLEAKATTTLYRALYDLVPEPPAPTSGECPICNEDFEYAEGISCQHDDQELVGVSYHVFCRECARRYVEVGVHEMPLAPNGDGLKCMDPECQRSICSAAFENVVSEETMNALRERCWVENSSKVFSLERCKTDGCTYAIEIEAHPAFVPAFECPVCGAQFC
ncbi:hypothetical protein AAVH_41660, partial [Aphelenchoides avenae]